MYGLGQPLDNLGLKTERAKKHILDLETAIDRFMDTKPYAVGFNTDSETGNRVYHVTKITPVPAEFSLPIGDALNNLRSALDHLTYQLVSIGGGSKKLLGKANFPIGNSILDYRANMTGIIPGLRQDAIKALDALQPYIGGKGEYFVHPSRLNNFDKHRLLVPAWSYFSGHTMFASDREWIAKFYGKTPAELGSAFSASRNKAPFPLKAGDVILTVPKVDIQENMQFIFKIAFGEPKIAKGNPVVDTLHEMTKMVRKLIFDFDRFGLFRTNHAASQPSLPAISSTGQP
jgi:hypothetical protein